MEALGSNKPTDLADCYAGLGRAAHLQGDIALATHRADAAVRVLADQPPSQSRGQIYNFRAALLAETGDHEAALALLRDARADFAAVLGETSWLVGLAETNIGEQQRILHNHAAAERHQVAALAILEAKLGAEAPLLQAPLEELARIYLATDRPCAAKPVLTRAVQLGMTPALAELSGTAHVGCSAAE